DFSREQKAFLRARDWLLGAAMQTDDLVFNFSGTNGFPAGFGAVLSSRGVAFLLEDSHTNLALALLLTPEQAALYAPRTKQRLVVPTEFQITASLSVLPSAQSKSGACC